MIARVTGAAVAERVDGARGGDATHDLKEKKMGEGDEGMMARWEGGDEAQKERGQSKSGRVETMKTVSRNAIKKSNHRRWPAVEHIFT